jgi:small subunit ribosomal protein S2
MAVVTMRQLLESGVHFGHQTRRWNPKMKRFIYTERNGIYVIDLRQSLTYIDQAYDFVKETVAHGGSILFVGTKKQAQETVAEQATRVGMPYVNQRWLGGMLTNFQTVNKRLQRLKELEVIDFDDVANSPFTKKELLFMRREHDKLAKTLGGIRDMARVPSAVWIVDTKKEHLAVDEARKLGIPIVAILDTNCDPDEVDYKIPGNDDAIRAVTLLTRVIADAVADGLLARHAARTDSPDAVAEPLAAWERELLEGSEAELSGRTATEAPAEVAEAPAEVAEAPAEVAEAPAEVAEAPAEVAEAPAEVPEAPAEVAEAPAEAPAVEAVAEEAAPEVVAEAPVVEAVVEEPEAVVEEPEAEAVATKATAKPKAFPKTPAAE